MPARPDGEHDGRRLSGSDDDVLRAGTEQCTKSHVRNGRSSPSTSSTASPESTRKSSWSASQWYIPIGSPGPST